MRAASLALSVLLASAILPAADPEDDPEVPSAPASMRRAAVSDTELAAEVNGVLYLEILAGEGATASAIATAYTGSTKALPAILAANDGEDPRAGAFYRLPFESLLNDPRREVLAALYPEEMPPSPLEFASDDRGRYALYRLKSGEALYSAVVVRFCGLMDPAEVNALAAGVAKRSGIADVKRIPAGYPVKIPLESVLPEFLPAGAPQREEAEATVAASARYRISSATARLEGVHVVLDAGHGGDDSGAFISGLSEHEYAYDVMCRVRDLLLHRTAAQVVTTIRDRSTGYRPQEGKIRRNRAESLLSQPPFDLRSPGATSTGVNLRWRFANDELAKLAAQGASAERVVFLSLHADSLHPDIRGTMVYVPGLEHRRGIPAGRSRGEIERSEGLSRALAREVVAELRRRKIAVHASIPIRDHVIRGGRQWVPAVLRASRVPHSLLIETANLNNPEDRKLIVRSDFRQAVASSIVDALIGYYARESRPGMVARGSRLDSRARGMK